MADGSSEARYLPLLAGLLLLILGGTAWLAYDLNAVSGRPEPVVTPGVDILIRANAASLQAHRAIAGDQNAYAELAATSRALDKFRPEGVADSQRSDLANIRSEVARVLAGKNDVLALQAAISQLNEWAPAFVDAIYELQGELSIQRQPVVIAQ